ncbi:hypothetical protein AnaeK_3940 [Anaeromyxobacter sp. K]|uniref:BREX system ATP-binding domain-containing protein n=1 Tax=Anaeromyxobacter sp. (strain K) TaxID=447217 RepID=UPI00015F8A0C|nr:BREX system ATP-binding domain-containing protein [Anaeromyxobacter sp. K]ACG75147.1 hypothetical protein AnaeK_3940 [Anaeromyxobacter sp. K]
MPNRAQALRIIQALRDGKNCLESVSSFSAGREPLIEAASGYFEDLEIAGNAVVRWVRGRTGLGKTHFFARLIELAHARNWVTSYVQISDPGYGTELHRFHEIYSAIVGNCLTKKLVGEREGKVDPGCVPGWDWILDEWWGRVRRLVAGSDSGDLPSYGARDEITRQMAQLSRRWSLNSGFQAALRQYALARADGDEDWADLIRFWFKGEDVHARDAETKSRFRAAGVPEPVNQRNSKEMLRSLSAFITHLGYGGTLILLDELENVLHQPPKGRKTSYTLLRELIDNVDDRQGMVRTAFYISATPDVFDSEKGISEYEALAERVILAGGSTANPAGAVIDLASWPLTESDFAEMAVRIAGLHALAKNRELYPGAEKRLKELLGKTLKKNPDLTARSWVKTVIKELDEIVLAKTA